MKQRLFTWLIFSLFAFTPAFGADAEPSARFAICENTFAYNFDLALARTGAKRELIRQFTDAFEAQVSIGAASGKVHISIYRDSEQQNSCRPQILYFSNEDNISKDEVIVLAEIYSSLTRNDQTVAVSSISQKCLNSLPKRWDVENHKEGKSQHVPGATVDCTSDLFTDSSISTEMLIYPEPDVEFKIRTDVVND